MNLIQVAMFEEIGLSIRGAQVILHELKGKISSGHGTQISQFDLDGLEAALNRAAISINTLQVGEIGSRAKV